MIPAEFEYHAPTNLEEAISLLHEKGEDAKLLAGGQSLIPAMRFRLAQPAVLIDLGKLDGLEYIREGANHLVIGAMTRESALEDASELLASYPLLLDTAKVVADPLVRQRATIGGNLAHADPANDHPATMLAYAAELVAQGPAGQRTIPIDDFFTGLFENSLAPGEILTEVRIPRPVLGTGGAYLKLERKVGDYAISAAAVQLTLSGQVCNRVRIGLTNVSPVPMRATQAELRLTGQPLTEDAIEEAAQLCASACDPSADLRGSEEYKRDVTRVLVGRAIRLAVERAGRKGNEKGAST